MPPPSLTTELQRMPVCRLKMEGLEYKELKFYRLFCMGVKHGLPNPRYRERNRERPGMLSEVFTDVANFHIVVF
jgi:hypothetical protein